MSAPAPGSIGHRGVAVCRSICRHPRNGPGGQCLGCAVAPVAHQGLAGQRRQASRSTSCIKEPCRACTGPSTRTKTSMDTTVDTTKSSASARLQAEPVFSGPSSGPGNCREKQHRRRRKIPEPLDRRFLSRMCRMLGALRLGHLQRILWAKLRSSRGASELPKKPKPKRKHHHCTGTAYYQCAFLCSFQRKRTAGQASKRCDKLMPGERRPKAFSKRPKSPSVLQVKHQLLFRCRSELSTPLVAA